MMTDDMFEGFLAAVRDFNENYRDNMRRWSQCGAVLGAVLLALGVGIMDSVCLRSGDPFLYNTQYNFEVAVSGVSLGSLSPPGYNSTSSALAQSGNASALSPPPPPATPRWLDASTGALLVCQRAPILQQARGAATPAAQRAIVHSAAHAPRFRVYCLGFWGLNPMYATPLIVPAPSPDRGPQLRDSAGLYGLLCLGPVPCSGAGLDGGAPPPARLRRRHRGRAGPRAATARDLALLAKVRQFTLWLIGVLFSLLVQHASSKGGGRRAARPPRAGPAVPPEAPTSTSSRRGTAPPAWCTAGRPLPPTACYLTARRRGCAMQRAWCSGRWARCWCCSAWA